MKHFAGGASAGPATAADGSAADADEAAAGASTSGSGSGSGSGEVGVSDISRNCLDVLQALPDSLAEDVSELKSWCGAAEVRPRGSWPVLLQACTAHDAHERL